MSELVPIPFAPGVTSDVTNYAAAGRWWFTEAVRFLKGYPEKIGGWQQFQSVNWQGLVRNLEAWADLGTNVRIAIGTTVRALALNRSDSTLIDITPVSAYTTLGSNPLASTSGTGTVTVTMTAHGLTTSDFVRISGATTFAGLTVDQLNGLFAVVSTPTANTFTITTTGTAGSSTSGGGSAVIVGPLVEMNSAPVTGWGTGPWGTGGWGASTALTLATAEPPMWSFAPWGEDLAVNPRGGGLYYYDVTTPTVEAVAIASLAGAADVPTQAIQLLVEPELNYLIALGCTPIGSVVRDPMFIRWADRGSARVWTVGPAFTSGGFRLGRGSRIITGMVARREIIVWSDTTLYALQAVGGGEVFRPAIVGPNTTIAGPMAAGRGRGDVVYWMGRDGFYAYDGRVTVLPCEVHDRVFDDINLQTASIVAAHNPEFNEMWWFYPSAESLENDRYVIYNYGDNEWAFGTVVIRTAWLDSPLLPKPVGGSTYGLAFHEVGTDNGDGGSPVALISVARTAPFEVDDGRQVMSLGPVAPDFDFLGSAEGSAPTVAVKIIASDYAGSSHVDAQERLTQAFAAIPSLDYTPFTPKLNLRCRGRKFVMEISNSQIGVFWRAGKFRAVFTSDGSR